MSTVLDGSTQQLRSSGNMGILLSHLQYMRSELCHDRPAQRIEWANTSEHMSRPLDFDFYVHPAIIPKVRRMRLTSDP